MHSMDGVRTALAGIAVLLVMGVTTAIAADVANKAEPAAPAEEEEEAFDQPSVLASIGIDPAWRKALRDSGVRVRAIYTGDLFTTLSGGFSRGTTFGGRLDLGLEADLEKLMGWKGATFHVNGFLIHGRGQTADHIGNLFAISNAEATPAARLFELWLEQKIGTFASLRIGQLAADSEFLTSDRAGLFINGTFGWPGITGADLPSGGPAYPLATPGARLELDFGESTKLRLGVFNGDPAGPFRPGLDPNPQRRNPDGLAFRVNDGTFLIAELEHKYKLGPAALPGVVKAGVWYHSGSFDDQRFDTIGRSLARPFSSGIPASLRANWGPYAIIDQTLFKLPGKKKEDRDVGVFARISGSPDDRNLVSFYVDTGINVKGPFPSRPDDVFGIGFAYAKISDRARALDFDTQRFGTPGFPIRDYEALIEVSYKYQVVEGWTIQPDFQYVMHPGGHVPNPLDPTQTVAIKDAAVFGVRSTVQF
jgi:porin